MPVPNSNKVAAILWEIQPIDFSGHLITGNSRGCLKLQISCFAEDDAKYMKVYYENEVKSVFSFIEFVIYLMDNFWQNINL